ncbi:MAG: NADH-quinone oxidoreductase subunit NuoE [Rickettsiaceae bacterium]|nr:MAG: NADH-quinone oxidoreductase subunit NuoE [Rickettsiaceae bacterium]
MTFKTNNFAFNEENTRKAHNIISRYPIGRQKSAVLALLDLAQRQHQGWLPQLAIEYVAKLLDMPYIRAYEIATFYSMFNLNPVGKYHIQVCGTTPCWLRGADNTLKKLEKKLAIKCTETTNDKLFSLVEVECLGACINAPVIQVNDEYFENVTENKIDELLEKLYSKKD